VGAFVVGGNRDILAGKIEPEKIPMPKKKEELKAQLMAEAEKAINQMLKEVEGKEALTITDVERLARRTGQQMMKEVTQQLAEGQELGEEKNVCPDCGRSMRNKGRKEKNLLTETGEIRLGRDYYYCLNCRRGIFPPGQDDGIDEQCIQP